MKVKELALITDYLKRIIKDELKEVKILLHDIKGLGEHMAEELERLQQEVAETKTVIDSAIVLLGQLADLIRQNATSPAALNALADDLDAKQAQLAAAITANTPETT